MPRWRARRTGLGGSEAARGLPGGVFGLYRGMVSGWWDGVVGVGWWGLHYLGDSACAAGGVEVTCWVVSGVRRRRCRGGRS